MRCEAIFALLIPKLAIKLNTRIGDLSPFCDSPTNVNIGAEIIKDETNQVVCQSCAYEISSHLVALLNVAKSNAFSSTLKPFQLDAVFAKLLVFIYSF